MKNKYFIGQEYKTIKEKNDLIKSYDSIQKAKLTFLNEVYDNENTLKNMWSLYNNHIHPNELVLGKDVMFFNQTEVDEILASRFRLSQPSKNNIVHFINIYKRWGVGRGDISGNVIDVLNRREIIKDMSKVLINNLWGLGKFYNLLVKIETASSLSNAMPLLLARYGITGKQMIHARSLRCNDIDYENKRVRIIDNGKLIRYIDVDDRFLEWIDKYKLSNDTDESTDYNYILKKSNSARDESLIENYSTINSKVYTGCKSAKIDRIAFGDLIKSRYIDLLLEIRETRKITTDDIQWVYMNFRDEVNVSAIYTLKDYYEALTKDMVIDKRKSGESVVSLEEKNSKEVVDKIRKQINFEEFINGEEKFDSKEIEVKSEVSADLNKVES